MHLIFAISKQMIIQIILNALIGLQLNIFAFVMIMQDDRAKAKEKKKHLAEKSRIESQKLSLRHMPKLVSLKYI